MLTGKNLTGLFYRYCIGNDLRYIHILKIFVKDNNIPIFSLRLEIYFKLAFSEFDYHLKHNFA